MAWQYTLLMWVTILALANWMSDGFIADKLEENFGNERGELIGSSAVCLWGINTYPPLITIPFLGWQFPGPSWDDVTYAIFATIFALAFIHLLSKWDPSIFESIMLGVLIWVGIKLLALYFILTISGCKAMLEETYFAMEPIQVIGMILAPYIVLKFVIGRILK